MAPHSRPILSTIQPTTQAKITPFPTQQQVKPSLPFPYLPNPCPTNREDSHSASSTNAIPSSPLIHSQQNHCQAPSITGLTAPP
ncbi:hypothetical protein TNIN_449581 [Trichonephila inaurata madagascariensis]|uniref:Uncharacterized protein n=1 Tax=Trichonephila inaurata madagascariensis TaxID=2747483 RepID=A0A8X6I5G4_9ARAC|nr:hypothetical protein TNIN_449581 [Trichonephila inaurata madagascariensis]